MGGRAGPWTLRRMWPRSCHSALHHRADRPSIKSFRELCTQLLAKVISANTGSCLGFCPMQLALSRHNHMDRLDPGSEDFTSYLHLVSGWADVMDRIFASVGQPFGGASSGQQRGHLFNRGISNVAPLFAIKARIPWLSIGADEPFSRLACLPSFSCSFPFLDNAGHSVEMAALKGIRSRSRCCKWHSLAIPDTELAAVRADRCQFLGVFMYGYDTVSRV